METGSMVMTKNKENIMRYVRVRHENGERYAEALRNQGYEAKYLGAGSAPTTLHCGCSDPDHCPPHESAKFPLEWGAIQTSASGTQAHNVFVALKEERFNGHL